MSRLRRAGAWFVLLLLGMLAGSVLSVHAQTPSSNTSSVLQAGKSIGQTFVAADGGLAGLEIFLSPESSGDGQIVLHIRTDTEPSPDLATASLPLRAVRAPGFSSFPFPPINDSTRQSYYAVLELQGEGRVRVGTAPGDSYQEGALYEDDRPLDAQMVFRPLYDPIGRLNGWATQIASFVLVLGIALFLYVLPGLALLTWVRGWDALSWAEKLGLAAGVSLALYPLLFLWTDLLGIHLGALYAWAPGLIAALALMWRNRTWRPAFRLNALSEHARFSTLLPNLVFLAIVAMVFLVRLWCIRQLEAPMWGDAHQHTAIAQLLFDHGGLFESWQPYAPYGTLTVQFGFPAFATVLAWMTGWSITSATLWTGQIINGLAVLTLYPLAMRLTEGNRWAGIGTLLVAGLVSPMPAFYVNWGRYAQLAGQAILPVSLWLLWAATESKEHTGRKVMLAGGTLAGMLLAYYRMPFYYGTFVLAWLIGWGAPHCRLNPRLWLRIALILAFVALAGAALFAPWVPRLVGSSLANSVESGVTQGSAEQLVWMDYQVWANLPEYVPWLLQVTAILALVWSLVRKEWAVSSLALWVIGLASLVAGRLIRLPGANLMQNFAVLIALYIPVGLLVGWLIGRTAELVDRRGGGLWRTATGTAIIGIALFMTWNQRLIAQPQTYALVTHPDMKAMAWVREHTPRDALFLVEGFRIYDGHSVVGSDAGWWIPLLAGRANTMPPQYALLNEQPLNKGYSERVVELVARLEKNLPSSPEGARLLCDWGISYVYVGQLQGYASLQKTQLFAPDKLLDSPFLDLVYRQDRVSIFALNARACESLQ